MFSLKSRKDGFRLLLPKEFIAPEIEEKYTNILRNKNSFFHTPIDFLNETIQKVQVLGFNNATTQVQLQPSYGSQPMIRPERIKENEFMYPSGEYTYRSQISPISLIDKTLNIEFRHTLGYLNYFLLFENFWYLYSRDRTYEELRYNFNVDIFNEKGSIYCRIVLVDPFINGIDMLDLDFSQPTAQSGTFKVEFKYNNFDFQFIEVDESPKSIIDVE